MESKLSVALLEAFCALGFVVCGVVLGFCFGGLIGPRLMNHGGQGLAEIGAMLNGAILGTVLGALAAVAAFFKASRSRRQRLATSALALAALTALFTALVVQRFNGW
jgi:peptidoglycan/LPS O-acetylase OafA/YrhL